MTEKLEQENREKGYMYESITTKDKFINNLTEENNKLKHNLSGLGHSKDELLSKNEKLGNENNHLNKKVCDSLNENNFYSKRIDDLTNKLQQYKYERENSELSRKKIMMENETLKNNEKEMSSHCKNLQNNIFELNLLAKSTSASLISHFSRTSNNNVSENLVDFLNHISINYSLENDFNPLDFFKFIDELSKLLSAELKVLV